MEDKSLYWGLRIALGVVGLIALFRIVPYFTKMLLLLVELFKLTDTTPEFKIILVCLSIYVNFLVINLVVNIVFKLHSLLEDKLTKTHKKT